MVLINCDFWGSDDELEKLDKAYKDMAKITDGVEYLGRYSPNNFKWHWTYFFKVESLTAWDNGSKNYKYKRDKKNFSHGSVLFYV